MQFIWYLYLVSPPTNCAIILNETTSRGWLTMIATVLLIISHTISRMHFLRLQTRVIALLFVYSSSSSYVPDSFILLIFIVILRRVLLQILQSFVTCYYTNCIGAQLWHQTSIATRKTIHTFYMFNCENNIINKTCKL